jgi:BirA family transcriptional regulator, biotin operon repressor / biotin---[acetyl-CoA-carboxylase] ligase
LLSNPRGGESRPVFLWDVRRALRSTGWRIVWLDEVGSTNDVARAAAERGFGERLAVFAELQTRGRGQHGRQWITPPGRALLFSTLWRDPGLAESLPMRCGVAIVDALARFGVEARLKWPNDVLIDGAKVAGVLVEGGYIGERPEYFVAGIGLNVLQTREELPETPYRATSLRIATGRGLDRAELAAALLDELVAPRPELEERWRELLVSGAASARVG